MTAWSRIANALFNFDGRESGLVRLLRTEYSKEYHALKRMGYEINDETAKNMMMEMGRTFK